MNNKAMWREVLDHSMKPVGKYSQSRDCANPNCPIPKNIKRPALDPSCTCGGPFMIVIPPGEHFHPCKVHPDVVIYGAMIVC